MEDEVILKLLQSSNLDDVKIGLVLITQLDKDRIYNMFKTLGQVVVSSYSKENFYVDLGRKGNFPVSFTYFKSNGKCIFYGETQIHYIGELINSWPIIDLDN